MLRKHGIEVQLPRRMKLKPWPPAKRRKPKPARDAGEEGRHAHIVKGSFVVRWTSPTPAADALLRALRPTGDAIHDTDDARLSEERDFKRSPISTCSSTRALERRALSSSNRVRHRETSAARRTQRAFPRIGARRGIARRMRVVPPGPGELGAKYETSHAGRLADARPAREYDGHLPAVAVDHGAGPTQRFFPSAGPPLPWKRTELTRISAVSTRPTKLPGRDCRCAEPDRFVEDGALDHRARHAVWPLWSGAWCAPRRRS